MPNPLTSNPYVKYRKYQLTKQELDIYNNAVRLIESMNKYKNKYDKMTMRDLIFTRLIPMWVHQHDADLARLWREDQVRSYKVNPEITYPTPKPTEAWNARK